MTMRSGHFIFEEMRIRAVLRSFRSPLVVVDEGEATKIAAANRAQKARPKYRLRGISTRSLKLLTRWILLA